MYVLKAVFHKFCTYILVDVDVDGDLIDVQAVRAAASE